MNFKDTLETLPAADHLRGLDIVDTAGAVSHHIPAAPGKLGSLKLYHALAAEFNGRLNAAAAERGLALFAEHVADAAAHPGKHPNIDLLVRVKNENLALQLRPLAANP